MNATELCNIIGLLADMKYSHGDLPADGDILLSLDISSQGQVGARYLQESNCSRLLVPPQGTICKEFPESQRGFLLTRVLLYSEILRDTNSKFLTCLTEKSTDCLTSRSRILYAFIKA